MKRFLTLLVALTLALALAPAALAEYPAAYREVQAQYGLPAFTPITGIGLMLTSDMVGMYRQADTADQPEMLFTKAVLLTNGGTGEAIEGAYDAERDCWYWTSTPDASENSSWSFSNAVIELSGEVPCTGGYRCELVYREHTGNAFFSLRSQPLTNTGLRLYDADGSKVLEVWPAAEEFSLRAWLVTFYTADGEACTVEYEPDKGDVADTVYIMTADELLAQNPVIQLPENPPKNLAEALALFPEVNDHPDFIPEIDLDGTVRISLPAELDVQYAVLTLFDMNWWFGSNWQLAPADDASYVLADPTVLPRVMDGLESGMTPGVCLFYQDSSGLMMYASWAESRGWSTVYQSSADGRAASITWTPDQVQVTLSGGSDPAWFGFFDPETGELQQEY